MAITNARIQVRRGLEKDFNPDEMTPGEWAVSTDKKIVRMCIYPGFCLRMATYEAFEEDMKQIQTILTEARTIQEAVTRINTEVSANAKAVAEYTSQAKQYRDEAKMYKEQASAIVGVDIATETIPGLMAGGDNAVAEDGTLMLTRVTTDRTLFKSKAGGLKINSIAGESQQKQYSGKNLYDEVTLNHAFSYSGVTATKNAEGHLTFSGTSTKSINEIMGTFTLSAGTYYMTAKGGTNITPRAYNRTDGAFLTWISGGFTLIEESTLDIRIQIASGVTVSGTVQIQIEEGDTATDYEPYVGNQQSPNPEYSQSIDSVVVKEIKGVGKNLLYNSDTYEGWLKSNNGGTILDETYNGGKIAKYTMSWNHRYPPTQLFKAGTYTISFDVKVKTNGSVHIYSVGLGGVSKTLWITASNTFSRQSFTFTLTEDKTGYIAPIFPSNSTVEELYIANIQVEMNDTATDYEPYHESTIQLSSPITLRGIGDVKDVVDVTSGKMLENICKFVVDSSISITQHEASTDEYLVAYFLPPIQSSKYGLVDIKSTHFTRITDSELGEKTGVYGYLRNNYVSIHVSIPTSIASDVTALKTWMIENGVEFYYGMGESIETDLPLADQIALHSLETFDTVTYISTDSTIEPVIEKEYGTSVVGGYALKGMNATEVDKLTAPVNNLLATVPGKALDAAQGKVLNDKITAIETQTGGCYLKYENGKFFIGYDDNTNEVEV